MTTDLLAAITASARKSADVRERAGDATVRECAARRAPRGGEFVARLSGLAESRVPIIAECKRRSPSRGILRHPYDPVAIACGYEIAGAAAISILTEATFFDGALDHLSAVRDHVSIPLLRKDFIATPFQVVEARAAGADAVLLIVGALDVKVLAALMAEATQQGLAALVEVHSRQELKAAMDAGATVVGVNSRNLKTLDVDLRVFDELINDVPDHVTVVAESGLREAADLRRLRSAGYDAFLIGERFMTTPNPGEALARFLVASEGGPVESGRDTRQGLRAHSQGRRGRGNRPRRLGGRLRRVARQPTFRVAVPAPGIGGRRAALRQARSRRRQSDDGGGAEVERRRGAHDSPVARRGRRHALSIAGRGRDQGGVAQDRCGRGIVRRRFRPKSWCSSMRTIRFAAAAAANVPIGRARPR